MPKFESTYTDEQKFEAAMVYLVYGNAVTVEKHTGINARTVRMWTQTEWWMNLMEVVKASKQKELDAHLTRLIHDCTVEIEKRLKQGDAMFVKGELRYCPVKAIDVTKIMTMLFDRRAIIRGNKDYQAAEKGESKDLQTIRNMLENFDPENISKEEMH